MGTPSLNKSVPRHIQIETDHFQKLDWRKRIKILFGFNLIVRNVTRIDKRSGRAWVNCELVLTDALSAKAIVSDQRINDCLLSPDDLKE